VSGWGFGLRGDPLPDDVECCDRHRAPKSLRIDLIARSSPGGHETTGSVCRRSEYVGVGRASEVVLV
jgi:hypothetical protein